MNFEFTPESTKKFEETLARYPNKMAALLPVLWIAQRQHGYLPLEVQEYVAKLLGLSPAHVYGVVTFYTMFKTKPVGKFHLQVCRTLSCALRGGEGIIRHVEGRCKIKNGEVTKDGRFSLEEMECLASCGTAPAMAVNEAYFENLTVEKVDQLLDRLQNQ
jgi:NADH-quinone oxidoreductase E subunit